MSCDGNRGVFHSQVCGGGGGGPVAASFGAVSEQEMAKRLNNAFGSSGEAEVALEEIFERGRRQAPVGNKMQQTLAEAQTQALFKIMRERKITPPTHSADGLPKKDAQFGYAEVYKTLTALRDNKPLPALAARVQQDQAAKAGAVQARTLSGIRQEVLGRHRCMGCGEFARPSAHTCRRTATPDAMRRSLMRRLGVPRTAYPEAALTDLIAEARASGTVEMRHPITGEMARATLDGMMPALTQGFSPSSWGKVEGFAMVEVSGGRIVSVLNDAGLTRVGIASGAVGAAAAASGKALPAGASIATAGGALPTVTPAPVTELPAVAVAGGSAYNAGRFIGTEYRKARGAAKGETVEADGQTYIVGDELTGPQNWSSARHSGIYLAPPKGITVGRTLVRAAELLRTGSVFERAGKIEVYDADGHLAAVYDPATSTAADVNGIPNASSAQMAAVMAYRAMHPATDGDRALATDLANMKAGTGTAVAVADGGYIAIHGSLNAGDSLNLGGNLGARKCPECGKWMGEAGCQAPHATKAATPAPVASAGPASAGPVNVSVNVEPPVIAVEAPNVTIDGVEAQVTVDKVEVTAQVDVAAPNITVEPKITIDKVEAQVEAKIDVAAPQVMVQAEMPPPQVNVSVTINPDDLAAALGRMGVAAPTPEGAEATPESAASETPVPIPPVAPSPATNDPAMAAVLSRLVDSQSAAEQRTMAMLERLAGIMAGGFPAPAPTAEPEPKPEPAPAPKREPVPVGRVVTGEAQRTEQERLVAKLRRQAPDPSMSAVPAWARPADTVDVDLNSLIPRISTTYSMNEQARKITRTIGTMLHMGAKMGEDAAGNLGAFGLYGPPGSGKNELARQFAASVITVDKDGVERQGMPYFEREIDPTSDPTDLIGGTAIENGRTVVRLGPVGQMLAMGGVVALNEVVRSPKLLTALQSAMEPPRTIRIPSPEGGVISIPVHPSSVVFTTWNPGMENDPDRPGGAPLARMASFRLDRPSPEEQCARATSFFERSNDPEIKAIKPHPVEVRAAVDFFAMVCSKLEQEGLGSGTVTPGARELNRFLLIGKTEGWDIAMETLKIYCAQNSQDLPQQWADFQSMFETCFGPDGQDVADRVAGASPARSN